MEPSRCIKIGNARIKICSRKPSRCIKIGNACIKICSRKPSRCIKIGNACIGIGYACIKIAIAFGNAWASQCIKIWNDSFSVLCDIFRHCETFMNSLNFSPGPHARIIIGARTN